MTRTLQTKISILAGVLVLGICGCSDSEVSSTGPKAPPVLRVEESDEPRAVLPSELRRRLKANELAKFRQIGTEIVGAELFQSGVKSIEALRGLALRSLDLGATQVTDLSPIEGMPITSLILEETPVTDLSPIRGMPIELLYLQGTTVSDFSILEGMPIRQLNLKDAPVEDIGFVAELPLQTLWLNGTNVSDISILQGKTMESLDISGTQVESLETLAGMLSLRRLNIAETPITDLTPLQGLRLERLTLSPEKIVQGMDVIRAMESLTQIQLTMEGRGQSASDFWRLYDEGVWSAKPIDETSTPDSLLDDVRPKDVSTEEASPAADPEPISDEEKQRRDAASEAFEQFVKERHSGGDTPSGKESDDQPVKDSKGAGDESS